MLRSNWATGADSSEGLDFRRSDDAPMSDAEGFGILACEDALLSVVEERFREKLLWPDLLLLSYDRLDEDDPEPFCVCSSERRVPAADNPSVPVFCGVCRGLLLNAGIEWWCEEDPEPTRRSCRAFEVADEGCGGNGSTGSEVTEGFETERLEGIRDLIGPL